MAVKVPTSLLECDGLTLTVDPEDVDRVEFSTPRDIIDKTPDDAAYAVRELGTAHVYLHITFKEGARPVWVPCGQPAS